MLLPLVMLRRSVELVCLYLPPNKQHGRVESDKPCHVSKEQMCCTRPTLLGAMMLTTASATMSPAAAVMLASAETLIPF